MVALAVADHLEAADGFLQRDVLAGGAGEHLGHGERLREELLDLARTVDGVAVVFTELVHAEDGDDVLQLLVALQGALHATRGFVVLVADHQRIELAAGRCQRIHGRVNAEAGDVARQRHRGIEVGEGGRGRRVGVVVGGHVDGLDRGDRTGLGRGDALLQAAHFIGQGRLVAHGGGHAAEQRRHFRSGQGVAIDVVDEEQDVATLAGGRIDVVAEIFGHGQAGQRHTQAVARRLVHLAVHHGHFRLLDVVELDHTRVDHLVVEVVAFAGALAHAGEHRQAGVLGGDVVDEFKHVDGLADAGAAEQADLAALGERANQVNDFDAGFQQVVAG